MLAHAVAEALVEVAELREASSRQQKALETLATQRDMYKALRAPNGSGDVAMAEAAGSDAGGEAAAESRGDFLRSAPAPTIRLGAGVTRRALRATLRWAYSGALPFPADVSDGGDGGDGGDGEAADEGSARNARAKLAAKGGVEKKAAAAVALAAEQDAKETEPEEASSGDF